MSKVEVDQVDPQSGTTLTLGTSGDTVSIPSGVTLANAGTVTGIPASAISSGTLADARIPDLNASKITAGTIATARLGSGTASSSTFLRGDQTYAEAGGGYTQSAVLTPSGASVEFDNIPSGTNSIVLKSYGLQWAGSPGNISMQIGDSGGYETSGYQSVDFYRGVSAGDMGATASTSGYILAYGFSGTDYWNGNLSLNHVGGNRWVMGYWANDVGEYVRFGSGQKILSGELTKLKIFNAGGTNADGGNVQIMYQ